MSESRIWLLVLESGTCLMLLETHSCSSVSIEQVAHFCSCCSNFTLIYRQKTKCFILTVASIAEEGNLDSHDDDNSDIHAAGEILGELFPAFAASSSTHRSFKTDMRCLFVEAIPEKALKVFPIEFSKVASAIQKIIDKKETSTSYADQYMKAWVKFQNWGNVACMNEEAIREEDIGWDNAVRVGTRNVPDWPAALRILDWIQEAQKEVKARKLKEGVWEFECLNDRFVSDAIDTQSCGTQTQDLGL